MASRLVCVSDYESYANENLPKTIRQYFNSGANYEQTYRDNVAAFGRYRFRPRYMRDVSKCKLDTTLLGQKVSCPVGVSPMSMCRLAHPDGEVALAKACESEGTCLTLSMAATSTIEEIGKAAPESIRWFQVFVLHDREMTCRMVERAQHAGFTALVLTVDCAVHGKRYHDMRNQFALPPHLKLANFEQELKHLQSTISTQKSQEEWGQFVNQAFSPTHTWEDLTWLKSVTPLPVIAKGVITGEDAELALQHGADAVWVSNHGGRQLDCLPATKADSRTHCAVVILLMTVCLGCPDKKTRALCFEAAEIDALAEVSRVVNRRVEVYMDGGIRSGLDVLKALARGARAVFCGRPILWGLVHSGEDGARQVLKILQEELSVGLALSGVTDVEQVPSDLVVHESHYTSRL